MKMKKKWLSLFVASSFLLVSCGTVDSGSETASSVSDSETSSTSSLQSEESSVSIESQSSSESTEESSINESSSVAEEPEESTELNQEEAAMIERAKAKITELTGYEEGDQYLYLIDGIEGSVVSINVRENGQEVASSSGFYRYDDNTDTLQEMNILTGEYEDFPANE